jgi:hypothetical protein
MEVANLHHLALKSGPLGAALERAKGKGIAGVLGALGALAEDATGRRLIDAFARFRDEPEGVLVAIVDRPAAYLERWDKVARGRRVVGIAANDAHENIDVAGVKLDPYARSLRLVCTHLLAATNDERGIRAALERGRAYVAFEVFGDPRGFSFSARDGAGGTALRMGEESAFQSGLTLVARSPRRASIRLFRDGREVAREDDATELRAPAKAPGVFRVEVTVERRGREVPWIISNPIYLREDRT